MKGSASDKCAQNGGRYGTVFQAHPGVGDTHVTGLLPERAQRPATAPGLAGTFPS
ncbi:hypothetical protein ACFYY3_25850 [Streptomyces sp. NPDC001812]|uniref:Uncharacterized protein n=1 Tax=Streptomyces cathayae TaxID=3031124 RepID=A0ABY8KE36_9ACTN|nr:hypothetical protein [Streptomyces sp. HUAS 5]WGD45116.1 hypothetical protein PYS65_01300 [Streptomyces sp. HUAS 5]